MRRLRQHRTRTAVVAAGLAVIGVTAALTLVLVSPFGGETEAVAPEPLGPALSLFQTPTPTATPSPTPTPSPTATPPPVSGASSGPVDRLIIRRFGTDIPVTVGGVDSTGAMETPSGVWEAAWYDFSALPGSGGNAVFAGHVDALYTGRPGPAAFWHLRDLEPGDVIEVRLGDGSVHEYAVTDSWSVDGQTTDLRPIIGATDTDVITLITCGGSGGNQYDQRLVVRAQRISS